MYFNLSGILRFNFYYQFFKCVKSVIADELQHLNVNIPKVHFVITAERNLSIALDTLSLRKNKIKYFNVEFHTLLFQNLSLLDLSDNELTYISPVSFMNLTSLRKLILAYNMLDIMKTESSHDFENVLVHIPNLNHIDMSHNALTSIPATLFRNNTKLEYVLLFGNKLSLFTCDSNFLPSLIDLHDNVIFNIDRKTILWFKQIFKRKTNNTFILNLKENTFQCSCQSIEFAQWLESSEFVIKDSPLPCVWRSTQIYINSNSLSMIKRECSKKSPGFFRRSKCGKFSNCLSTFCRFH